MTELYCTMDGCESKVLARGFCNTHYRRWHRHGSPHVKLKNQGELLEWLFAHVGHGGIDCLAWPFARNSRGYGEVHFERRQQLASRVMCILVHGQPGQDKMHAAHLCSRGHLGCVNPRHLKWATPVENAADKIRHGTSGHGERNPQAKLSRADVLAIRALAIRSEESQSMIAARFNISQGTVSDIKMNKRWGWLNEDEARTS